MLAALFDPGGYFFWLAIVSVACVLVERIRPWRRAQPLLRPGFVQDLFWLVFNGHVAALLLAYPSAWVIDHVYAAFIAGGLPRPDSVRLLSSTPLWIQFVGLLVVKDFFDWCIHNLLHRVGWLWAFHKVHHSIEALDWIGNFRFHWMEIVIYGSLTYLPVALLGIDARAALVVAVFGTVVGDLNHANLRYDLGRLRYVFNSSRFHVWHHDRILRGSTGVNFAIIFSAWDWIFGTAHYPSTSEQPVRLGFDGDTDFPKSLLGRLVYPLGIRRRPSSTEPDLVNSAAPDGGGSSGRPR